MIIGTTNGDITGQKGKKICYPVQDLIQLQRETPAERNLSFPAGPSTG